MLRLIHFISTASSDMQVLIFAGVLFICWNIETISGISGGYKKWKHASLNAKFIITNIPIQFLLGFAFAKTIQWTGIHHFGILFHLPYTNHPLVLFIISFILLDLGEFIYHLLMHKVKRLWMFHVVHHTDNVVDVSTTLREHPGENVIRNAFTLVWVLFSGVAFWALVLRQLIQIISNIFSHVNYRLPEGMNRVLGWVFITPNIHHVHHHYQQPYTDCNYGDVLSIWDRLFGTFNQLPQSKVIFGVDTYMDEKEHSKYFSLMKIPFRRYKKNPGVSSITINNINTIPVVEGRNETYIEIE